MHTSRVLQAGQWGLHIARALISPSDLQMCFSYSKEKEVKKKIKKKTYWDVRFWNFYRKKKKAEQNKPKQTNLKGNQILPPAFPL